MNEGGNQTEVVSDDYAMDELLKVENRYNEDQVFEECPQLVEHEVLVELHSIQNTNPRETDIVNSHLDSQLYVLVVEDTIPKLMGLNNLSSAYNVTTHLGIIVEAQKNITKIVSIEATLGTSENTKQEQNVDVEASSRFLTPLRIQKMAGMKVIMSTMKIEIASSSMLEIVIFRRMGTGMLELTVAISLSFDPGGTTFYLSKISYMKSIEFHFNWLNQLKEFFNGAKYAAYAPICLFLYSLDYAITQLPIDSKALNKWIVMRRFSGWLGIHLENIKSSVCELQKSFLAGFSLR